MNKIGKREEILDSQLNNGTYEDVICNLQELYDAEERAYENVKYIGVGVLIGIGLCVILGLSIIVTTI